MAQPNIKLYSAGYARSARCVWTLNELALPFENIDAGKMIGSPQLREYHPQAKLPAIVIDNEALFESAAICTYLCDLAPEKNLIAKPGTLARARHGQWTSFALTEMEGYLWSNMKHNGFYPEDMQVPAVVPANNHEISKAAEVFEQHFANYNYLVNDTFSVTDIIVGWTLNWARRMDQLNDFEHIRNYVARLHERPHCALNPE
ncbi:MAG: glutathione S-transferase family protein [Pseudomonadota bacterium]